MRVTTVHLVRHGQSLWNREGRLQGQTAHVPLTAQGLAEAEFAADELRQLVRGTVTLWSSDLQRARQSSAVIANALGVEPRLSSALREQSLGVMEGLPVGDLDFSELPDGIHSSDVRWGGGESVSDVFVRLEAFFEEVLQGGTQHVVMVSHGDTIRVAKAILMGRGPQEVGTSVPVNGSVQSVVLREGRLPDSGLTLT